MDQLLFLGTGAAMTLDCFTTAIIYETEAGCLLMDTGGGQGILRQCHQAGFDLDRITDIYVSHSHTDHILGVPWLIRYAGHRFQRDHAAPPLHIYASENVLQAIMVICEPILPPAVFAQIGQHILLIPVTDGSQYQLAGREITFFDTEAEKTPQLGLFTPLDDNSGLTFLGDEPMRRNGFAYAQKSKYLIHNALLSDLYENFWIDAHHIGHSTVADAAKRATAAGVSDLILFHAHRGDGPERKAQFCADAARFFNGNIYVPDDLEIITLNP